MRPKKVVLLVFADDGELSMRRYLLTINGYKVLSSADPVNATAILAMTAVMDLVLVGDAPWAPKLIAEIKFWHPHRTVVLIGAASADPGKADSVWSRPLLSSADFLQRVRILSQRRRGPRKKIAREFAAVST